MSAVPPAHQFFFQPLSLCLVYPGVQQTVQTVGTARKLASQTGSARHTCTGYFYTLEIDMSLGRVKAGALNQTTAITFMVYLGREECGSRKF